MICPLNGSTTKPIVFLTCIALIVVSLCLGCKSQVRSKLVFISKANHNNEMSEGILSKPQQTYFGKARLSPPDARHIFYCEPETLHSDLKQKQHILSVLGYYKFGLSTHHGIIPVNFGIVKEHFAFRGIDIDCITVFIPNAVRRLPDVEFAKSLQSFFAEHTISSKDALRDKSIEIVCDYTSYNELLIQTIEFFYANGATDFFICSRHGKQDFLLIKKGCGVEERIE